MYTTNILLVVSYLDTTVSEPTAHVRGYLAQFVLFETNASLPLQYSDTHIVLCVGWLDDRTVVD